MHQNIRFKFSKLFRGEQARSHGKPGATAPSTNNFALKKLTKVII